MDSTNTLNHANGRQTENLRRIMSALSSAVRAVVPSFLMPPGAPGIDAVRGLCVDLLADVPGVDREALVQRLDKMRRIDDMPHLRGALFDAISHFHGESIARERIGQLDRGLQSFPGRDRAGRGQQPKTDRRRRR